MFIKCLEKKILSDTLPNCVGILPTQTSRIMNELYQFLNDSTDFAPLCIMAELLVGRMFNMSILSLDIGSQTDQVKTKDYQTNNNPRNSLNSIQRPKSSQFKQGLACITMMKVLAWNHVCIKKCMIYKK